MLKESNATYQDGTPVQQPYSEMEKQLCRDYPNFGPKMWETVKNVNIVMKIMIGMFFLQGIALLGFIAFSM